MSAAAVTALNLACGALLLCAVLVLWRRELRATVPLLVAQGLVLAVVAAVLAGQEGSGAAWAVAAGVLVLRAGVFPALLRRALAPDGVGDRETRPAVGVAASLLVAALLTLLAYAVSRPLTQLAPSPATSALPVGLTVVLIGFFVLTTRRRAVSQVVGFLVLDNGITAVALLTTTGVGLVVELGVFLDVLLVVLVLRVLTARMREAFGDTDLDELREVRD